MLNNELWQAPAAGAGGFYDYQIEQSQYKYYQVLVQDHWGLQSTSNIQEGCSWFIFNQTYGDASYDYGRHLIITTDGGYIITGSTRSYSNGRYDVYLIKTDPNGNTEPYGD